VAAACTQAAFIAGFSSGVMRQISNIVSTRNRAREFPRDTEEGLLNG
jgi:hypothetical protein